jgi:flavin reductase (DIM6/NTAB) family NADH-FMN oxidoreductase RutF
MAVQLLENEPNVGVDSQDMRDALAQFASGVTVVTTQTSSGPLGITVSSFSAVSLDPPLVLWSLAKSSHRTQAFENAKNFAIHILSGNQKQLGRTFAKEGNAFNSENSRISKQGLRLLDGSIAIFECCPHAVHDGGDHLIFVARVEALTLQKGDPLIYYDRSFGTFKC